MDTLLQDTKGHIILRHITTQRGLNGHREITEHIPTHKYTTWVELSKV